MRSLPLVLVLSCLLAACGEAKPGAVAGDVFLAVDLGNEQSLANARVSLLADDPELDSTLAKLCPKSAAERGSAWEGRARILGALVRKETVSDANARFAFDSVAPGRYRLWADTTLKGERWTWLHPVKVEAGDTARVTLSNDNPDENPFRCDRSI
ncbi:MAG TPA: carboxypeptidase-like regulatory domain-containing protein, partial [Longimicrobium sp.]|nr:carboxypeptidase-like regulatory domain-containing protein [Longimicrobium sp.]